MFEALKKTKLSTGIQVTDDLVRFVSFRIGKDTMRTHAYGEEFLSAGVVKNGKIVDPDRLTQVLSSLRKKHGFDEVTVVLPEEQSFIFYTTIPDVPGNELQQVIQDHINSFLKLHSKISVRDLICEYEVLGEQDGNYEIQVTVTPQALVETYIRVFEDAGLDPTVLEVGSHMVSQACVAGEDGNACMLVDFGDSRTHITTVSDGHVMESATIAVGKKHLSPVVEKFLNVNGHEANTILSKYGVMRAHKEPQLLSELLHELSPVRDYIDRQFIDWHTRQYKGKRERNPIRSILLHGEGARLSGFAEHLAVSTRIPVEHANVWASVPKFHEAVPDMHYYDTFRFATAVSAALQGMRKK